MPRATRSKPAPEEPSSVSVETPPKILPPASSNPPKLFVLPTDATADARIVTLPNPATTAPSRYFFCPTRGFYEFTRIAAPKRECRSWLLTSSVDAGANTNVDTTTTESERIGNGYVTKNADIFLATPIDTLFLVLPALAPSSREKDAKQHFRELDDYLDALTSSGQWRSLLATHPSLRSTIEKKLATVCDTVDAGDETMYRISATKLQALLLSKAERMVARGLPESIEDKLVKSALEVPVMSVRREDTLSAAVETTSLSEPTEDAPSNPASTSTPTSDEPIAAPALTTPPEIPYLLRLQTSLLYLTKSYLPPTLAALTSPSASTLPLFAPLTTHLAALATLKAEAAALRSISDNISRKRGFEDDEEKIAEREEKKRKKEEEERKKKAEGRGVKALKKVDTSGMKKMSAFFKKVEKKA